MEWRPSISSDFGVECGVGRFVDYIYQPRPVFRNFPIETDVKKAVKRFISYNNLQKESRSMSTQISDVHKQISIMENDQSETEKKHERNRNSSEELKQKAIDYIIRRDEFLMKQRSRNTSKKLKEVFENSDAEIVPIEEPYIVELTENPKSVFEYRNYLFDLKEFIDNQRDLMQIERSEMVKEMEALKTDHEKILMQEKYNEEDHEAIKKKQDEISKIKYLTRTKYASFQKEDQMREAKREMIKIEKLKLEEIKKQIIVNKEENTELYKKNKRAARKLKEIREKLNTELKEVDKKKNVLQNSIDKMNQDSKSITEHKKVIAQIRAKIVSEQQRIVDEMAAINIYKDSFQKEFAEIALEKERIREATKEIMEKRKEIPNKRKELGLPEKAIEIETMSPTLLQQQIIFLQRDYDVSRAQIKIEKDAIEELKKIVYPTIEKPNIEEKGIIKISSEQDKTKTGNEIQIVTAKDQQEKEKKKHSPSKTSRRQRTHSLSGEILEANSLEALSMDEEISDSMLEDLDYPSRKSRSSTLTSQSSSLIQEGENAEEGKQPVSGVMWVDLPEPVLTTIGNKEREEEARKEEEAIKRTKMALEKADNFVILKDEILSERNRILEEKERAKRAKRAARAKKRRENRKRACKRKEEKKKEEETKLAPYLSSEKEKEELRKEEEEEREEEQEEEEEEVKEKEVVRWTFLQPRIINPIVDSDSEEEEEETKEEEEKKEKAPSKAKSKKSKKQKRTNKEIPKAPKVIAVKPPKIDVTIQDIAIPKSSKRREGKIRIVPVSFIPYDIAFSFQQDYKCDESAIYGDLTCEEQ